MKYFWSWAIVALTSGFVGCVHPAANRPAAETNTAEVVPAEAPVLKFSLNGPSKKTFPGGTAELALGMIGPADSVISTGEIEWAEGKGYGWDLWLRADKPSVTVKSVFTLPAADGSPRVREREYMTSSSAFTLVKTRLRILPGDPKGLHNLKVYLDGELVFDVNFAIQ